MYIFFIDMVVSYIVKNLMNDLNDFFIFIFLSKEGVQNSVKFLLSKPERIRNKRKRKKTYFALSVLIEFKSQSIEKFLLLS